MPELIPVEIKYRGKIVRGEWCVEGGSVHVTSTAGNLSGPLIVLGHTTPSGIAKKLLCKIARNADPRRPFFYWL